MTAGNEFNGPAKCPVQPAGQLRENPRFATDDVPGFPQLLEFIERDDECFGLRAHARSSLTWIASTARNTISGGAPKRGRSISAIPWNGQCEWRIELSIHLTAR